MSQQDAPFRERDDAGKLTPEALDCIVRGSDHLVVLFVCPMCDRAHEPKDLGTSLQCRSCERGLPTEDRPRCPDCTNVRPLPDDALWFTSLFFKRTS